MALTKRQHVELQPRDWDALRDLVYAYRVTTAALIAEDWGCCEDTARRRLTRLVRAGYLVRKTASVAEIPPIVEPLIDWTPGEPAPDLGPVATITTGRWDTCPSSPKTVFLASRKLLRLEAAPPRKHFDKNKATHELGVHHMYRWCRAKFPLAFVSEDVFAPAGRGHGTKVEDAMLIDDVGKIHCIVDYLGAYRRKRLHQLLELTEERSAEEGYPIRFLGF